MDSNEVILKLQKLMVEAVLSGQPLPGHDQPISLPDLEFVTRRQFIYLSDTNLASGFELQDLSKPLKIMSTDTLRQEVQQSGRVAYLQFHVNEVSDSAIDLRLETRIASSEATSGELGLSSVRVKFSKQGDDWKADDAPLYSAA